MIRRKKSKELSKKKDQLPLPNKDKFVKFNISYDNLKCFIIDRYPKTDRKRPTNRYGNNLTDQKKYKEDSRSNSIIEIKHRVIARELSPDPSREAVNLIIEQIQKKGVKCQWNDIQIEQGQSQVINQEQWRQRQQIDEAFSQRSSSYGKNSHASTIDRFPVYYTVQYTNFGNQQILMSSEYSSQAMMASSAEYIIGDKITYYNPNSFDIDPQTICYDPRTTLMVRNIPNKYTIQDLSYEIDLDFANTYDFLYLPCDIKNNCNVGYGFINFVNTEMLFEFYKKFHNKRWIKFRSDKICVLTYARLQGLSSLIEHFQNSKVLNHKDKRYKPIIKDVHECKKIQSLIKQQKIQQSQTNESTTA